MECQECSFLFVLWVLTLFAWFATSCVMDYTFTKLKQKQDKEDFEKNARSIIKEELENE